MTGGVSNSCFLGHPYCSWISVGLHSVVNVGRFIAVAAFEWAHAHLFHICGICGDFCDS